MCSAAQQAVNAHIVKGEKSASTILLLPKHQDKSSTGIRTRIQRRLSRCLRAVTSGLNGSAQSAAMSGKLKLHCVQGKTAVVLGAVKAVKA